MGRTAEVSLVLWVLCLPFASHIWVVPIWRVAIIHSPVIMHPVLCACRRPSPMCTRRSIELAHSHSFLYPLALFLLGMWEFIPSMSIEPETDKAMKDEFHYRLVLSVGCEFIAYMPFGYSSCLADTHAQLPAFCLYLCQITFSGMGPNLGCRPTLLLKSNTLLRSLKSTTAPRPRPV